MAYKIKMKMNSKLNCNIIISHLNLLKFRLKWCNGLKQTEYGIHVCTRIHTEQNETAIISNTVNVQKEYDGIELVWLIFLNNTIKQTY